MKVNFFLLILLISISIQVHSQTSGYEYFITANANLYLPSSSTNKGAYPILWYDKNSDPKLLIGGFGFGVSAIKELKPKIILKTQANFSKHTYWDEPGIITDTNGSSLGYFLTRSSDYSFGITATVQYALTKRMSIGTGFGAQVLLASFTRLPKIVIAPYKFVSNHNYKPLMPGIPCELSWKLEKVLLNIRYEFGLLNRLKGDLSKYKTDRYSLLTFETGFRIK